MAGLSLREAAEQVRKGKSTILRAIQSGRMSATRLDDGGYSIDPAELFRVYPPVVDSDASQRSATPVVGQAATPDLLVRNAQLEAEINAMKQLLDNEKARANELRDDRDRWAAQAERLALPAPVVVPRNWWRKLVG